MKTIEKDGTLWGDYGGIYWKDWGGPPAISDRPMAHFAQAFTHHALDTIIALMTTPMNLICRRLLCYFSTKAIQKAAQYS